MTTILGCIADDFTGATDLAGLLSRGGAKVSLRIGAPEGPPADTAAFEVIALKSRTAPVQEAVDECLAAAKWLQAAGARTLYWKYCSTFDSTEQGNIGPVAEALMELTGAEQTIYCPAFPENGRSVFMGNLFVGRQPLAESPMKDHPLTPMRDSNIQRLLAPQVSKPVGLVDRLTVARGSDAIRAELAKLKAEGAAHIVMDAVADDDLKVIAQACQDMPLLTGGSALAMPLPALLKQENESWEGAPTAPSSDETIVLSGSCSAMTRAQVGQYLSAGAPSFKLDPLQLSQDGPGDALNWLAAQDLRARPIIYATAEPDAVRLAQEKLGVEQAGAVVEAALAQCAQAALNQGARRFVVAGGETSGAVTKALGVSRLDVGQEVAPGVPWTFCESGGHRIALALKSGNFGAQSFFKDAINALEAP